MDTRHSEFRTLVHTQEGVPTLGFPGEGEYRRRRRRKKQTGRKKWMLGILLCLVLLLLGTSSALAFIGYQQYTTTYRRDMPLAQQGIQHLRTAQSLLSILLQHPGDTYSIAQAQREFRAAATAFRRISADLPHGTLSSEGRVIPVYGVRLYAAAHLIPLALAAAQAGDASCDVLSLLFTRFRAAWQAQGHGLTMADMTSLRQGVQRVDSGLQQAIAQSQQLQPSDVEFDSRIAKMLDTFQKQIPRFQAWARAMQQLVVVVPTILGVQSPTSYLLEMLDSTELRPGGGFIGNYGVVTFAAGRLQSAHITDVDLLDRPAGSPPKKISYPAQYAWFSHYEAPDGWSLRDSNLDADFPQSARNGEKNYALKGGTAPLHGVIAITPALIQQAMTVIGPVTIPEYGETATAQNLVDLIHYHQLVASEGSDRVAAADGHSSLRKHFTELLAEHFLDQVRHVSPSLLPKFVQVMLHALQTKDVQIYFNDPAAQTLLQQYHIDAAIQSPPSDSLFVVDANVAGDKANAVIQTALTDQITFNAVGSVLHRTTLRYSWPPNAAALGSALYRDYVRVYVPPGSVLHTQDGWEPHGTSTAFGREVWAGLLLFHRGETHSITLTWITSDGAQKDSNDTLWHYHYLVQKQAGSQWAVQVEAKISTACVMQPQTTTNKQTQLIQDMTVNMSYRC